MAARASAIGHVIAMESAAAPRALACLRARITNKVSSRSGRRLICHSQAYLKESAQPQFCSFGEQSERYNGRQHKQSQCDHRFAGESLPKFHQWVVHQIDGKCQRCDPFDDWIGKTKAQLSVVRGKKVNC